MTVTTSSRPVADDRIVVVTDPRPGTTVELAAGSHLGIRFRRGLGPSRWRVAERPAHLLPLAQADHEFQFLVFGGAGMLTTPLRLERSHPERPHVHEVCEILVVAVSDVARTSTSASRRTA